MSSKRIEEVRKNLEAQNIDGLIITNYDWMDKRASLLRYLCGYSGSTGLLIIGPKRADFFTDFRYTGQASKEVKGAKVNIVPGDAMEALKEYKHLIQKNWRLGYDSTHFTMANQSKMRHIWPDVLLVKADEVISETGWVKDQSELNDLQKAADISDRAFELIFPMIKPGIRENELSAELEYQMIMLGSEVAAFDTICASGYRSALPHGAASTKKVKKGDFVTFDFGATVNGYVSDMTRTVVAGKATDRQKKIYNTVLKAQKAGVNKVKAGVSGKAVDEVCRNIITKAGYGKQFGHGTGHGIGYFVHIGPRLSPLSKDILKVNQVITVEPGIYIPKWGGVRIEDDVVVTKSGCKVLNKAPKNLLEL